MYVMVVFVCVKTIDPKLNNLNYHQNNFNKNQPVKCCNHCKGTDHQRKSNKKCRFNPAHPDYNAPTNLNPFVPFERNKQKAGDSYLAAYTTVDDYHKIIADDIGDMVHICKHCNSYNFLDEVINDNKGGHFKSCCHNGKVKLPKFAEIPNIIKNLFTNKDKESKEFKEHIRNYNSACAFASMSSNLDSLMDKPGTFFFQS